MAPTLRTRRDFAALEARRQRAAQLFARGQRQADIVRELRVSRETASRWYDAWRAHGAAGLRGAGRAGRKPRLDAAALQRLEAALLRGPTAWGFPTHLWTLQRIVTVIWKVSHVRYSVPQAWRLLRQLGWSRQRPARQAKERDPEAVARWIRTTWPRVKKTPDA
jgi:transposase